MSGLSSTVTFLSTDIEGSTKLLQRLGDSRYARVLTELRGLLHATIREGDGREISSQGDSALVVFRHAGKAVRAAVAAQLAITMHPWGDEVVVRVRMGLHTGEPVDSVGDPVGLDVHRAARVCAAGHGGQILLSGATWSLVENDLPEEVRVRDLGSHRLKDLKQPERIFQLLHPELPAEFLPLRSLSAQPNNLPFQLTSFIGRELEIAEITRLLPTTRLLTLTGSGGCGKTRLGLEIAATLLGKFEDGAWFVELSALSDPTLVPHAIASVLSVPEQPGQGLAETLVSFLRPKSLLLVLDNCEHLVDSCAHVAERLLRACSRLRTLATSREPLNIGGEVMFRVPSLSLPDSQDAASIDQLMSSDAVRLFVDRAKLVERDFGLTPQNVRAVAQVCRRLDGIPLAIELAAALVKVLSMEQIVARLDDVFGLPEGNRTALPRQKTLRATMDWSYGLLSEKEQVLLRRLSVFAGGWTLDAAEAVSAGEGIKEQEVLGLLADLVDKSLVLVDERELGPRYRQLGTVRQYSQDLLLASGEALVVRRRHAEWFLRLAERAEPELLEAEQAVWFDRLEVEHDNLRTALEWCMEGGEVEAGVRLASALWRFWVVRGYSEEGRKRLEAVLRKSSTAQPVLRAMVLHAAGSLAIGQSDYASASKFFEESLAIWEVLKDRKRFADTLRNLGLVATSQGDQSTARSLYEQSLALLRDLGHRGDIAVSLNNLGMVIYRQGDEAAARSLLEESLALLRELGNKQHIAMALTNLGLLAVSREEYAAARALYAEGLVIRRDLGDRWGIAYSLEGFAGLAAAQGQMNWAVRLLGAAEALREAIHAPLPPVWRTVHDRTVATIRSEISEGEFVATLADGRAMKLEQAIAEAVTSGSTDREKQRPVHNGRLPIDHSAGIIEGISDESE